GFESLSERTLLMKTGIYQIRNMIDNKRYVGSAARSILNRWSNHKALLSQNRHYSRHLQNAWNKYGEENFIFEVLLYCDPEYCLMYEQIALDHYQPAYNTCKVAGSQLGTIRKRGQQNPWYGKKHRQDTKIKMAYRSAKLTLEQKQLVEVLLSQGLPQAKIAEQFGIAQTTVSAIKRRVTWRHC